MNCYQIATASIGEDNANDNSAILNTCIVEYAGYANHTITFVDVFFRIKPQYQCSHPGNPENTCNAKNGMFSDIVPQHFCPVLAEYAHQK